MTSAPSISSSTRKAVLVCSAAMISLAIAMGVGRFAFTPMFPLMVRDGLLNNENGTLLAASNYLGYLLGAMLAGRIKTKPSSLLIFGLVSTAVVTGAVGWTSSVFVWALLRLVAGIMSAWTLIAASAWGLAWLASLRQQHLAGIIFAGVGLGIAAVGVFCAVTARFAVPVVKMWMDFALLAGFLILFSWIVSARFPSAVPSVGAATLPSLIRPSSKPTNRLPGAPEQALGRSRGGLTTKIHMLCDALGRPLRLLLTGRQKADCQSATMLLAGQAAKAVIADKGYDTNEVRAFIRTKRMKAVIPAKRTRKHQYRHDKELYAQRNLIERYFGKLKIYRRIATRFDRNDSHFLGFLYLACSLFWIN